MPRERVTVSCTPDRFGRYQFWKTNKVGSKFPYRDPDAVPDNMKAIFSIEKNWIRCSEIARSIRNTRGSYISWWGCAYEEILKIENRFIRCLQTELKSRGVKGKFKVAGQAFRTSKAAWQFSSSFYLFYADSGALAKLVGMNNIEKDAWRRLARSLGKKEREILVAQLG